MQQRGEVTSIPLEDGTVELPMPNGDWPGSEYHPLFAVHWEVIIRIKRDSGGPLLFVKPLLLKHDGRDCIIEDMPTQSGRSELADS